MCMVPAGLLEQQEWRRTMFGEMVARGAAVSAEQLRERQASVKPKDPTLILYTSGTTGFPKGAMLTHHSVSNDLMMAFQRTNALDTLGDHYCLPLPFFHIAVSGIAVGAIIGRITLHPLGAV